MDGDLAFPDNPGTGEPEFDDDELEVSRKNGLEVLDHLIALYYNQALATIKKNFKPGDLIKLIDLRYRLSPTTEEQIKFWQHLAKVRRAALKKAQNYGQIQLTTEQAKKNEGAQEVK